MPSPAFGLTGCDNSSPLAKAQRPNTIRIGPAGSFTGPQTVVTKQDAIDKILSQIDGLKSG
jgi:hypothetical protein